MRPRKTNWSKQGCRLSKSGLQVLCFNYISLCLTARYSFISFFFRLGALKSPPYAEKQSSTEGCYFFSYLDENKHHFQVSFTMKKSRYLSFNYVASPYFEYFPGSSRWFLVTFSMWPTDPESMDTSETCQLTIYGLLWSLLTHYPRAPRVLLLRDQSSSEKWAPMHQHLFLEWVPTSLCASGSEGIWAYAKMMLY